MHKHRRLVPTYRVAELTREYRLLRIGVLTLAVSLSTTLAQAEPALTRQRIAELVRTAPQARVTRADAAVSQAIVGASRLLSAENPVISGLGGVRFNPDGSRPFSGVASLSWPVDIGGKRGARIDAAKADQRAASVTARNEERLLLFEALLQHSLVLKNERLVALAAARHALSERVHAAAERRRAAGSVPELDVVLAAMQGKRDESHEAIATGASEASRATLFALLGLSGTPAVEGALIPSGDAPPLALLLTSSEARTDVLAARGALEAAQLKASRERAGKWPTVHLIAQYERDDRANIGLLGLAVPIPGLGANRLEVAASAAEVEAASSRLSRSKAYALGQITELHARYVSTKAALEALEPTAILTTRAVSLATRGYELGESDLASVLLVRREAIDAESALLEATYAHASAKIELLVSIGKLPQ
ncbi:MAG: putative metal ion efflux outer membrane proteinputative [Pseudomonadota bacterium]|jgi:cobalt-zinc-cadmium efflux system outer membrane protein